MPGYYKQDINRVCIVCEQVYKVRHPTQIYCCGKCHNADARRIRLHGKVKYVNWSVTIHDRKAWSNEMNRRFSEVMKDSRAWERLRNLISGKQKISVREDQET